MNLTVHELRRGLANNVAGTLLCVLVTAMGIRFNDMPLLIFGILGVVMGVMGIVFGWRELRKR
jgi:hypothetical protein